jgi:hypothetical protein
MTSGPTALAGFAVAALLLAGCSTTVTGGTPSPESKNQPAAAGSAGGTEAGAGPAIDVCSFFTSDDVARLIGSSPAGKAQSTPGGGSSCTWQDTDTYSSLTVDIGDPDTAINGTLPAWDPALGPERTLPGGMRDINGSVEFVCGGTRLCSVQVVKEIQGDADQKTAIGLVDTIRAKVGG